MTNHCMQRLQERYLIDADVQDINCLRKLLKSGYYIKMSAEPNGNLRLLTRYKGRYIVLVTDYSMSALITALPYQQDNYSYVEEFVKEFG